MMKSNKRKNNKKKNLRGRSEIGNNGAMTAIKKWDQKEARREEYKQNRIEYNKRRDPNTTVPLPTLEEIDEHFKPDPTGTSRLLCNKDDNKWKIVLPHEEIYDTAMEEFKNRSNWSSVEQFKAYMKNKYYVPEIYIDRFIEVFLLVEDDEGEDE